MPDGAPAPACDSRPSCQGRPNPCCDSAATTSPPTIPRPQTAPPPIGNSPRPQAPQPRACADRSKVAVSYDAGLLSSQHLESQTQAQGNPFRFRQSRKRSSSPRSRVRSDALFAGSQEHLARGVGIEQGDPKTDDQVGPCGRYCGGNNAGGNDGEVGDRVVPGREERSPRQAAAALAV